MRTAFGLLLLAATPTGAEVRQVVIDKTARTLTVLSDGTELRKFGDIKLGGDPVGPKHFQGDQRTPEGRYVINGRNPASAYHLSLRISYPDPVDRDYAARHGRSPGGDIFIHGQPNGSDEERIEDDWTDGCIALSDPEIEELWDMVPDGTEVAIVP